MTRDGVIQGSNPIELVGPAAAAEHPLSPRPSVTKLKREVYVGTLQNLVFGY